MGPTKSNGQESAPAAASSTAEGRAGPVALDAATPTAATARRTGALVAGFGLLVMAVVAALHAWVVETKDAIPTSPTPSPFYVVSIERLKSADRRT